MRARSASRYPRGERALIGALHRFSPEDTVAWFQRHGVRLKTEADGRMFPVTDSSGTVIDCLMFEAKAAGVRLLARNGIEKARTNAAGGFELTLSDGTRCSVRSLASRDRRRARTRAGRRIAESFGHTIEPPVPSLFSLHVATPWLRAAARAFRRPDVELTVPGTNLRERGPLLITHNGVSGPSVLRLSAWGARASRDRDYSFTLRINWLPAMNAETRR